MQLAQPDTATSFGMKRRLGSYSSFAQDAVLILVASFFFYIHIERMLAHGVFTSAPFAIEQGLLVGLFLTRRRARATSRRLIDWVAAVGGWLPFAFMPADNVARGLATSGTAVQMVGLSLTIVCFMALGRSFGIVAANRGLKVNGPYRIVRHPIYFAHVVTMTGFVLANLHAYNVALFAIIMAFQVYRMNAEERVLTETGDYSQYASRVRWRLIPGVY